MSKLFDDEDGYPGINDDGDDDRLADNENGGHRYPEIDEEEYDTDLGYDEEGEDRYPGIDKAKIFTMILPFVLIILVLAVSLLVSRVKKGGDSSDSLQESIMEYADGNREEQSSVPALAMDSASTSPKGEGQGDTQKEDMPKDPTDETGQAQEGAKTGGDGADIDIPSASPTPFKETMLAGKKDYSKVEFHSEEQLRDMMAYWEDNNQKAINDLVYLDHYIAMSFNLRGTDKFYYYGDTNGQGQPNGKGIAVYADNRYYYGDWANGAKSGNGTWMHYHIHFTKNTNDLYTYHHYTGSWLNDLPDGEGSEHYEYDMSLVKGTDGYLTNRIGSYKAGLVDGEFYLITAYANGDSKEWDAVAENGSWTYQSDSKDKKGNRTVYVDRADPNNYFWMHPKNNVDIGIPCLIPPHAKSAK